MEVENNRLRARQRDQGHYRWRRKGGSPDEEQEEGRRVGWEEEGEEAEREGQEEDWKGKWSRATDSSAQLLWAALVLIREQEAAGT